jgi:transposase InsO family protein
MPPSAACPSKRQADDERILVAIRKIHSDSRRTYGSPRVHAMLARRGVHLGRKRVARLMRREGLSGLIKRRRGKTTVRVPGVATRPDLVRREWNPTERNRLWVADITYCRTWEGWLYLAAVLDCHSRRVVGWSLRQGLQAELVTEAIEMAVARRRPAAGLVHLPIAARNTSRWPSVSAAARPASTSRCPRAARPSTTPSRSRSSRP